jgi:spoIIIJ-associated protein
MSSRERRIVHLALKEMPGVRTESVGVGEERQVVIHPAEGKPSRDSK